MKIKCIGYCAAFMGRGSARKTIVFVLWGSERGEMLSKVKFAAKKTA